MYGTEEFCENENIVNLREININKLGEYDNSVFPFQRT
jgi:hypothetical protein